ncbi:MAG: DUF1049 domain-containing protein, partial [Bdellovibrionales bacterium]|nr:DUF1049 domain-containing protein [Bdellovibrionales bacterium]
MSGRIVKLLVLLLIAAAVSYVFYLNPGPVEVTYRPGVSWRLPLALVLIATFFVGVLLTALFAFAIGIKLQFATWRVNRRAQQTKDHHDLIGEARAELALGNFGAARALFQKVIQRDADDLEARVLLAESYRREGEDRAALRILEEARMEQRQNPELLLLASDLNEKLGNPTAAHDNAALVYKVAPRNPMVLARLVHTCGQLGRFDEAVSYQEQLVKLLSGDPYQHAQEHLAGLKLRRALAAPTESAETLRATLNDILKQHRDFVPALAELAAMECDALHFEEATKFWLRAFEASKNPLYLERIASMWIHADEPSRAVATVRNTLHPRGAKAPLSAAGQIFFVNLLLHLEMIDEARKEFERLKAIPLADEELRAAFALVKARILEREGRVDEAL